MKIVIQCAAGLNNLGDEAILMSFLQKYKMNNEITVICLDAEYVKHFQSFDHCINENDKACYSKIKNCDIFILGGGGLFQDETSIYNIFRWGKFMNYAYKCRKQICIYANSFGPLNYFWSRFYVRKILSNCSLITVRDPVSVRLLNELNIKTPFILTADSVFNLKFSDSNCIQWKFSEGKYVCIVVRHWFDNNPIVPVNLSNKLNLRSKKKREKYQKFISEMSLLVDKINKELGMSVIFLPFMPHRDVDISKKILLNVKNNKKNYIVDDQCVQLEKYEHIIEHAHLLIGMRLHSLIFAIKKQIPFINLSYSDKTEGFMEYINSTDLMVNVDVMDHNYIINLIHEIDDNYALYKTRVIYINKNMTDLAYENDKLLKERLNVDYEKE